QLAAVDLHRAARGVLQAHGEADGGLLAVGLERPALGIDVADPDVLRGDGAGGEGERGGDGQRQAQRAAEQMDVAHGKVSSGRVAGVAGLRWNGATTMPDRRHPHRFPWESGACGRVALLEGTRPLRQMSTIRTSEAAGSV